MGEILEAVISAIVEVAAEAIAGLVGLMAPNAALLFGAGIVIALVLYAFWPSGM